MEYSQFGTGLIQREDVDHEWVAVAAEDEGLAVDAIVAEFFRSGDAAGWRQEFQDKMGRTKFHPAVAEKILASLPSTNPKGLAGLVADPKE